MTTSFHRTLAGALCLGLSLAACNKDRDADTIREEPGAVSTTLAPARTMQVTDLKLGRSIGADGRVAEDRDDFAPNDTIYAVVSTEGTPATAGARLTARWTFEDGQLVDESNQDIAPTGPALTEFHVSKASGWPEGKYTVTVLLDGNEVKSEDFTVQR